MHHSPMLGLNIDIVILGEALQSGYKSLGEKERINPISRIYTYFFKIHSNIVLPSTPTLCVYTI